MKLEIRKILYIFVEQKSVLIYCKVNERAMSNVHTSYFSQLNNNAGRTAAVGKKSVGVNALQKSKVTFKGMQPANWRGNNGAVSAYSVFSKQFNQGVTPKIVIGPSQTQAVQQEGLSTLEKLAIASAAIGVAGNLFETLDKSGAAEKLGNLLKGPDLSLAAGTQSADLVSNMKNATTISDLKTAIDAAQARLDKLPDEIKQAKAEAEKVDIDKLQQEVQSKRDAFNDAESGLSNAKASVNGAQAGVTGAEEKLKQADSNYKTAVEARGQKEIALKTAETNRASAEKNVQVLQGQVDAEQDATKKAALQAQLNQAKTALQNAKTAEENAKKDLEQAKEAEKNALTVKEDDSQAVKDAKAELKKQQGLLEEKQKGLESAQKAYDSAKKELQTVETKLRDAQLLKEKAEILEAEQKMLKDEIKVQNKRLKQMEKAETKDAKEKEKIDKNYNKHQEFYDTLLSLKEGETKTIGTKSYTLQNGKFYDEAGRVVETLDNLNKKYGDKRSVNNNDATTPQITQGQRHAGAGTNSNFGDLNDVLNQVENNGQTINYNGYEIGMDVSSNQFTVNGAIVGDRAALEEFLS